MMRVKKLPSAAVLSFVLSMVQFSSCAPVNRCGVCAESGGSFLFADGAARGGIGTQAR